MILPDRLHKEAVFGIAGDDRRAGLATFKKGFPRIEAQTGAGRIAVTAHAIGIQNGFHFGKEEFTGGLRPDRAVFHPLGEIGDFLGFELPVWGHFEAGVTMRHGLNQQAVVGLAGNDGGAGFAAFQERRARIETQTRGGGVRVAGVTTADQKRSDFRFEEFAGRFRSARFGGKGDGGSGQKNDKTHRHNSTGKQARAETGWLPECYDEGMTDRHAAFVRRVSWFVLLSVSAGAASTAPADLHLIRGIEQAQLAREEGIVSYTVQEHYTLTNTRFNEAAEMRVAVMYVKGTGKTYHVLSRTGPSFLQTSVFDRVLKEEAAMSGGEIRLAALVTPSNYHMKFLGEQVLEGRKCEIVELQPLRKSPHLLRGKAWVDAASHNLIRIEGKPTASMSFWASSPYVVRDYMEVGEFSFARVSHATSHSFLLGQSELVVEYSDYQVKLAEKK